MKTLTFIIAILISTNVFTQDLELMKYDKGFPERSIYQQIPGDKVAKEIPLPSPDSTYKLNFLKIPFSNFGTYFAGDSFRTIIYSLDESTGKPDTNSILFSEIFELPQIPVGNGNNWKRIDLEAEEIQLSSSSFFVAVEWINGNRFGVACNYRPIVDSSRTWIYEDGIWRIITDFEPHDTNFEIMIQVGISKGQEEIFPLIYDNSFPDGSVYQQTPGDKIALKMKSPENSKLEIIPINITNYGSLVLEDSFLVSIYSEGQNGLPLDTLMKEVKIGYFNNSLPSTNANYWHWIDVSDSNLFFNGDSFFIAITWIWQTNSPSIGVDRSQSTRITWIYEDNVWTLIGDKYPSFADDQIMIRAYFSSETISSGVLESIQQSKSITLNQNYPNPFNPTTTISYNLSKTTNVNLSVYNLLGEKVRTLVDEEVSSGFHNVSFNAKDLSTGIYFYVLKTPEFRIMKKFTLLK